MMIRRSMMAMVFALAIGALPGSALAHTTPSGTATSTYTPAQITAATAKAGQKPSCLDSLQARSAWAEGIASNLPGNAKNPAASAEYYTTYLQLCGDESLRIDGYTIRAPKAAGARLPGSIDYHITITPLSEGAETTTGGVRARVGRVRSGRTHVSCWVWAQAPLWLGTGNGFLKYQGGITCQGYAPVKVDMALLRKYNSSGNVVVWATSPTVEDGDGVIDTFGTATCQSVSTWATRTFGQRYHSPSWVGDYSFTNYSAACPI